MREDHIHFSIRQFLLREGWFLFAGQYPDGSDHEIPALNVVDPTLARDKSPDHRRHSKNKIVPDLVALRGTTMLIVEMKPRFSKEDEEKLKNLLDLRRRDLLKAIADLATRRKVDLPALPEELLLVPALGFEAGSPFPQDDRFGYLLVKSLEEVQFLPNRLVVSP